jgi:multisubunit Na+/H+ antiporter MnhC subunit
VKIYKWFFIILTIAQLFFTATWVFFLRKLDRVILLSSIIYGAGMFIGYIAYETEKYRKRKKQLIDNLP